MTGLLALADRAETEAPSYALECEIGAAVENMEAPGTVVQRGGRWIVNRHGTVARPLWETYRPRPWLSDLNAAADLAPGDAREVLIRLLPNGGAYVRITLADGRVGICESIDHDMAEARARTVAALRALGSGQED